MSNANQAAGSPELDRWNARFAAADYVFGTEPNRFLASQAPRLKPGLRALCVADGEGRNSVGLAKMGLAVTAFDFSPFGLEKARRLAASKGLKVDYRHGDILDWDWKAAQYDVLAAIFIQFATPAQRAQIFRGFIDALAPGGLLLIEGYSPKQLQYGTGGPKQVENLYTEAMLREAFAPLEIIELREYDAEVQEGPGHSGMSALIDLVARKP